MENYVRGVIARESPSSLAGRGAEGAGRRRAHLRADDLQGRQRLRPVPGHALAGLRRRGRGDARRRTRPSPRPPARSSPTTASPSSPTSSPPPAGAPRTSRTRSSGDEPLPWLKSVEDPYDDESPKHRWGPYTWSMKTAAAQARPASSRAPSRASTWSRAASRRGSSPPTSSARGGRTRVTGATLRAELGLYDTWAYFTSIKARAGRAARSRGPRHHRRGTTPEARPAALAAHRLAGSCFPARRRGEVVVQLQRRAAAWHAVGEPSATTPRATTRSSPSRRRRATACKLPRRHRPRPSAVDRRQPVEAHQRSRRRRPASRRPRARRSSRS